jgi:hypothetical protein
MSLLDRLKKGKRKEITTPEGEQITIRCLSVREIDAYSKAIQEPDADHVRLLLDLMILAVVDADGKPVWTADDAESLRDLPLSVVKFVAEEIAKFSGVDQDSKKS